MIKIIVRIIIGLLPFVWGISWRIYDKKGKLETLALVLPFWFFFIGLAGSILYAIGIIGVR